MSKIYQSATELIGKTPLLQMNRFAAHHGLNVNFIVKLEYKNPAGSVKDRIALAMILDAEKKGLLKEGSVIVEPTSGNTGIGLASVAAARGYKVILTMPETMSIERRKLLKAYGATLILTEAAKGMKGAIAKAEEIKAATPGAFMPGQFDNQANVEIHRTTTGPEIWEDTEGKVDIFVAGIGTGGTITGTGEYLKSVSSSVKIIAVEPKDSPLLSEGKAGPHKIQGWAAGFIPSILNTHIYDEVLTVETQQAYDTAREIARLEGVLVGISSGAAAYAALVVAKRIENEGKTIVVLLPDNGERYLSTPLFEVEELPQ